MVLLIKPKAIYDQTIKSKKIQKMRWQWSMQLQKCHHKKQENYEITIKEQCQE
jgi:hypothetical protein